MLLDAAAGFGVLPAGDAHQQIHAGAATAGLVFAAALVAEPGAAAVAVIEPVSIGAAAAWAGLVLVGELVSGQAAKLRQQVRPPAVG